MLAMLADRLLDRAIDAGDVEVHEDGAWIHPASCPGFCDYGCGAIWVEFTIDDDGQRQITEVSNAGLLRVKIGP
jgi:hypothetical protein